MALPAFLLGLAGWCGFEPAMAADSEQFFTLLYTNDEHSAVVPVPLVDDQPGARGHTVGGFARLSRLVEDFRAAKAAAGEPVVLVSAADILGGTPYSWLMLDGVAPEISIMQQMQYDVITVGNHEFDYGSEVLAQYYRAAGYPEANAGTALVVSNLIIPEGHPLGDCGLLETHILELDNGLRLGFFGLLGINAGRLAVLMDPIGVSDLAEASAAAVASLRAQGADVVICVSHSGIDEDLPLAASVPGIDIMVTGHYHTIDDEILHEGDTILVKAGAHLQYMGVLELAYSPADGSVRVRNEETGQPYLVAINDEVEKDPVIDAVIAEYTQKLNSQVARITGGQVTDIHQRILYSDYPLEAGPPASESIMGNFVADAMRLYIEEKTGERVDFAIQANGVIRGGVRPGSTPQARNEITFYDFVTPVSLGTGDDGVPGYPLASIYLTGKDLYRMLELSLVLAHYADIFYLQISGGRFAYDPDRPVLFKVPFTNWPVPSLRAVLEFERYTGRGVQTLDDELYEAITRRDDRLYHVVCDSYILAFFPRIADMLPVYKVIPKDRHGNPLAIEDAIIHLDGEELKVWQAVVAHALAQPAGEAGIPHMPEHYAQTGVRIIETSAYPLYVWSVPVVGLFACLLGLIRLRRQRLRVRTR